VADLTDWHKRMRRKLTKDLSAALCDPGLHPTASLQHLLGVTFKGAVTFRTVVTLPTQHEELSSVSQFSLGEPEQLSSELPFVQWESALAASGLFQLRSSSEISEIIKSIGATELAVGYCRTSDRGKAGDERSSSLHMQRVAITQFRSLTNCLVVGYAYSLKGEPSYVPLQSDKRPTSKSLVRLLQNPKDLCDAFNLSFLPLEPFTRIKFMVVETLNRFSRDTMHALADLELLSGMGVRLCSARDVLEYDVSTNRLTPSSMFTTSVLLSNATFERASVLHRTMVGKARAQAQVTNNSTLPMQAAVGRVSHCSHPTFVSAFIFKMIDAFQIDDDAAWTQLVTDMNSWMAQGGEDQQVITHMFHSAGIEATITKKKLMRWACKYVDWMAAEHFDGTHRQHILDAVARAAPAMLATCQKKAAASKLSNAGA
jgi:hypothetical protein